MKEFEVHTIEEKGPTPWLAKEQLAEPNLRIITEAPPAEETLDSKTLRRVYKMKVSAVISDVSQSATSRYRHVIATSSKSSSPEKAITIESTFAPLVTATPAVLNWTVVSGISSSVERTVIVIDERTDQSSSPFRFRAGHDWLKVTTDKVTQQDGRSIHSFRVNFDAPRFSATLGESVTHSMLSFFLDNDETALVTVPVFVKIQ